MKNVVKILIILQIILIIWGIIDIFHGKIANGIFLILVNAAFMFVNFNTLSYIKETEKINDAINQLQKTEEELTNKL